LKELYLQKNQLRIIPNSFKKLKLLKFINLRDNPIISFPPFIKSRNNEIFYVQE
ncbi:unnamed protein product, partial [marine sediment metagenome]